MRTTLVLTVLGDDKPGLVERLSDQILASDANWEESRMAHLAGKFAGLLRVSVDSSRADALTASLRTLDASGLTVVVAPSQAVAPIGMFRTLRLELLGHDQPGIIAAISRTLASHHVNIEELETDVTSAPMSGEAIFRARVLLGMPSTTTVDAVTDALEAIAGKLMVDLNVDRPNHADAATARA
jgi:glycine cleavage system regulatory protein